MRVCVNAGPCFGPGLDGGASDPTQIHQTNL